LRDFIGLGVLSVLFFPRKRKIRQFTKHTNVPKKLREQHILKQKLIVERRFLRKRTAQKKKLIGEVRISCVVFVFTSTYSIGKNITCFLLKGCLLQRALVLGNHERTSRVQLYKISRRIILCQNKCFCRLNICMYIHMLAPIFKHPHTTLATSTTVCGSLVNSPVPQSESADIYVGTL
jgi:hypothetical protein